MLSKQLQLKIKGLILLALLLLACGANTGEFEVTHRLIATLQRDEGVRHMLYRDSLGNRTVGVGHDVDANPLHPAVMKRLEDGGKLSMREVQKLLHNDIMTAVGEARRVFPHAWDGLSQPRKEVLVNMAFNLGETHLAGFIRFRVAVQEHDYVAAATEMLRSKWASEVGDRATRLADVMRTGDPVHFGLTIE